MTVQRGPALWLVATLLLACAAGALPAGASAGAGDRPRGEKLGALEKQKLRAEIAQLETDERNAAGARGLLTLVAAPLTGLAAAAAIIVSLIGFRRERALQREQNAAARRQHLDERFSDVLRGLGSESESVQAGSAASLLAFLGDRDKRFHRQVRWATLANLKVGHTPTVRMLLVRAFEEALRVEEPVDPVDLDLSHALLAGVSLRGITLDHAKLSRVDLSGADLANCSMKGVHGRGARLEGARITGSQADLLNARLPDAKAPGANFGGANLVNAHLQGGDFEGASFRGARMQAAHLEGARLQAASFDGANLADAYFVDAEFDTESLESISALESWEKAHFSPDVERQIRALLGPAPRGGN